MKILMIIWCYLQLILLTHVITVLMGAPIIEDALRTFAFSIWIVIIGFSPMIFSYQGNIRQIYSTFCHDDVHLPSDSSMKNFHQLLKKNLAWCTVIGAWCGAFPIPLDWDRWWQRWPITCFVSATIGALLSPLFTYIWLWTRQRSNFHKNS